MKSLAEIRYDMRTAGLWLKGAESSLEWADDSIQALQHAKAQLLKVLPLVREAITDLDGLVQDRTPESELCPECGEPACKCPWTQGIEPTCEVDPIAHPLGPNPFGVFPDTGPPPEAHGINPEYEAWLASRGGR